MHIIEKQEFTNLTTWHIKHQLKYFTRITHTDHLETLRNHPAYLDDNIPKIILGKGANSLLAKHTVDAFVISIDIKERTLLSENDEYALWQIGAGEDWCDIVDFLVYEKNLAGIENLALIPGKVGAAPIQNIAAYGQVFEDICEEVHCYNLTTGKIEIYKKEKCQFLYRNSFFKQQILRGNNTFVIVAVVIKLRKKFTPETSYESNYESLKTFLDQKKDAPPSLQQVCDAIKKIRTSKLPSINKYGTNGSLFMNPIVSGSKLNELLVQFPKLQFYPTQKMNHKRIEIEDIDINQQYKIAAGHIFEKLQWRYKDKDKSWNSKIINQVGVWHKHSLVLVNYGTENPQHIIHYIELLKDSFFKHTGIKLTPEINIYQ